jgi:hypothetical protein
MLLISAGTLTFDQATALVPGNGAYRENFRRSIL